MSESLRNAWPPRVTLSGTHVRMEPLDASHHDGLVEAVKDGEVWKIWYTTVPAPSGMANEIERRLALERSGSMLPFTVFDRDGRTAGMTTYMNVDAANRRVEIGSTWYREDVRRTALNTEAKLLLLEHAFERLDCIAVEFRTSSFNAASRRAIERLGAKLDGVLRNHSFHQDGSLRDTCAYSITADEWPEIKWHLRRELDRER